MTQRKAAERPKPLLHAYVPVTHPRRRHLQGAGDLGVGGGDGSGDGSRDEGGDYGVGDNATGDTV
jgi:hypothetical protein